MSAELERPRPVDVWAAGDAYEPCVGLPFALDGSIPLVARTWAVRGVR